MNKLPNIHSTNLISQEWHTAQTNNMDTTKIKQTDRTQDRHTWQSNKGQQEKMTKKKTDETRPERRKRRHHHRQARVHH